MTDNSQIKPWCKWVGGKAQLLPELVKRLPPKFNTYHEPFIGGGALFLHLKSIGRIDKAVISDVNEGLINTWKMIQSFPNQLIDRVKQLQDIYNQCMYKDDDYYSQREIYNDHPRVGVDSAARFIFLNRTCFNGLYRENSKGEMNTPWGHRESVNLPLKEHLLEINKLLNDVEIKNSDFKKSMEDVKSGDFMYGDSPYAPLDDSSFTKYTKRDFGRQDQIDLTDVSKRLSDHGLYVMLSNSDCPFIRKIYGERGFLIETVQARRSVNSDGAGRGKVNELIIRNYREAL